MADVTYRNIYKRYYENDTTVSGFSLEAGNGEFIILLGPESCGNSDILKMTVGMEPVSEGGLYIDGASAADMEPRERGIAFLGRDAMLYPHMTVYENIVFRLKPEKLDSGTVRRLAMEVMDITGTSGLSDKKAQSLSPEQRQRVMLARAVVRRPGVLLLDHPMHNIPRDQRPVFEEQLKRIHKRMGILFLYATDDSGEAMRLADRIAVLKEGVLQQVGTPEDIYLRPENLFVATYVGEPSINLFEGRASVKDGFVSIKLGNGHNGCSFLLPQDALCCEAIAGVSIEVIVGVRPEHLREIETTGGDSAAGSAVISCKLQPQKNAKETDYLRAEYSAYEVYAKSLNAKESQSRASGKVSLLIDTRRLHLFDRHTSQRLYSAC